MVDLRIKYHFGRTHRVVLSEQQLCIELSPSVAGVFGALISYRVTIDLHKEVAEVRRVHFAFDSWNLLCFETVGLLDYSGGGSVHLATCTTLN